MFHLFQKHVQEAFQTFIRQRFETDIPVQVEQPKQSSFGEMAVPAAFQLAKSQKKAPKMIAAELVMAMPPIEGVSQLEVAGNGYINIRFSRGYFARLALESAGHAPAPRPGKIIVEHTNINPNKAAHIGHLRNAVLGDTFVRLLKSTGHEVETQNYIDNTGVQVADVVAAFHYMQHMTSAEVHVLTVQPKFDYVCWDLYARISQHYKDHPEALSWRQAVLHEIEAGHGELSRLGHVVADAIVECHLATMRRLGITYDVLPRESEILHLQFWATAFEQLKDRKAIHFETEGKNKGCWVMPGASFSTDTAGEEDDKVIVRSNGTVTYVGKDIAYQLWKFGLLGKDFHYRVLKTYPDGHVVWVSTAIPANHEPRFGHATQVFNVIDSRQSYLQDVVEAGLRQLGYAAQADSSVHFSYEMVALSPRTCVELGIELSAEDSKRPYVEVSGRKGLGIKADDLIDKLIENALAEVESRNPEAPDNRQVAQDIAVGALRYFLLKFTRNTVIAFDFQEALSFQGDTGPYVQYAAVRARKILRNYAERAGALPDFSTALLQEALERQLQDEALWQVLLAASKSGLAIEAAVESGEPSGVSRYAFQLAQTFSSFYHDYPVLAEENEEKRTVLLWMTHYFSRELEHTLGVLGIRVPDYM
ncbi:MAG: arginine--tRNA ligase [Bryobacteraceae bacterium]|nr:arginine--tRNA ligase [Bryobacteraceae bacterium]